MTNWFEAKIKYIKVQEDGREAKVSESYLVDALTYGEAENRVIKEMEAIIKGDLLITGLKKSNITELVESEDENDDRWYKAKVAIVDADEVSGREKVSFQYFLISAGDIDKASEYLRNSLSTWVVPYEIVTISDTTFMDVFKYIAE